MKEDKIGAIKNAIRKNFDASPESYQAFESRYGFFKALSGRLIDFMHPPEMARILDIGCGTGASCIQILDAIPGARVWGLDNSVGMLHAACSIIGESERLRFVEGDATKLNEHFSIHFDAIVYSASIFLIPDYKESLRQASDLLVPEGSVGLTFMEGLFDVESNNLFEVADRQAQEGVSLKKPVKMDEFKRFFAETFSINRTITEGFELSWDALRQFFSIPAMSAGLFPRFQYEERVRKVLSIFDHMPATRAFFRWVLMAGEKRQ